MAFYLHPDVLDRGLQEIIDKVSAGNVDLLLIKAYTQGVAYATVVSNKVMEINLAFGDLALANQGTGRKLVVAEKAGTISVDAVSPDLHVAIVDITNTKVLAVTDETGDNDLSVGNPKTIPSFGINMNQPV